MNEENKFEAVLKTTQELPEIVKSMSEQLKQTNESIGILAKAMSDSIEANKLEKERVASEIELKKSDLAKENADLKSQLEAKKFTKSANLPIFGANQDQAFFLKSEDSDLLKSQINSIGQTLTTRGSSFAIGGGFNAEDGDSIQGVALSNLILHKSSNYSYDVNPLGGYLNIPEVAQIKDQTNYSNEEKLLDMVGVKTTTSATSVLMPKYLYNLDALDAVKDVSESEEYIFDPVENFIDMQTVNLEDKKCGKRVSSKMFESSTETIDFIKTAIGRDIKRKIARQMIGQAITERTKFITALTSATLQVTSEVSQKTALNDLFNLVSIDQLRPDRFRKPILILNRKFVNSMVTAFDSFSGYANKEAGWVDLTNKTIVLPDFGTIPYISLDNINLMPNGGVDSGGKVAALLLDAEAYQVYVNPNRTNLTFSNPHDINVKNKVEMLMSMSVATAIVDPSRVAKLVIKA